MTCELLLFHRKEPEPYAVIPFPENCRIGDVFSMMVFGLDIEEFEYAYRLDGPWKPKEGLLFDKSIFYWIRMQRQLPDRVYGEKH